MQYAQDDMQGSSHEHVSVVPALLLWALCLSLHGWSAGWFPNQPTNTPQPPLPLCRLGRSVLPSPLARRVQCTATWACSKGRHRNRDGHRWTTFVLAATNPKSFARGMGG